MTNAIAPAPASKLTDMQEAFVDAFVANGGNRLKAVIDAGYSKDAARQQAHDLLKKPHVMQAIQERLMIEFVTHGPAALHRMTQLMNAKSDYVSLEATKEVLDRAGLKPVEKHDHRVTGDVMVNIDLG